MKHILVIASCVLLSSCFTVKQPITHQPPKSCDTVYVPQEVRIPYAVHDTVYLDTTKPKVQLVGNTDSLRKRIDTLTAKIVNARICIYNIQDYLNLCVANPKLNKFEPAWISRILHAYYFQSGEVAPTRKNLKAERDANKKKTTTKKK